jgi:chromosome segregation ATPase
MYIFGGRTETGDDLGDLAAFRISSRRWYTFQNMGPSPSPRSGHSMTAYSKQIVVLGGEPSAAGGDPTELSLVYLLDTGKIRYPNDQPGQTPPVFTGDRNAPGIRRPSGGDKNGPSQIRGPPGRGAPGMGDPKRIGGTNEQSREPPMGSAPFNRGPDPNAPGVNGAGSRLPRASLAQAPSGPPPQQSAPPPRLNGLGPPRIKTPPSKIERFGSSPESTRTIPAAEKENVSPAGPVRDSPSNPKDAPFTNGRRTPTQTPTKIGGMKPRDTPEPEALGSLRARSRQARQQASIDSTTEPASQNSTTPERSVPIETAPTKQIETSPKAAPVQIDRSQSFSQSQQALSKELDAAKSKNAWYSSELALARKAGYAPNATGGSMLDENSNDSFGDQERPLVEALLAMRAELARVQTDVETQTALAAKQIAEIEKQRDAAVNEAVYAKAKLAAHGGSATSTPQLEDSSRDFATMEMDRTADLNRKLASSLAMQNELQQKLDAIAADVDSERRARQHAEEAANEAHARVSELDMYKQKNASEVESLRAELHSVEKVAREEAAKSSEATSTSQMLQLDKEELSARLDEALGATKGHSTALVSLRDAVSASSDKAETLQQKLDAERSQRDGLENKLRQLRAAHEERTAELDLTSRRLKDAEEMAEKHAAEARTHREAVLSGLGRASSRDLTSETSAVDERVRVLQAQLDHSNTLTRKSQAAADAASEKLRSAEERIAGLESYQEQASRDGMSIRKQLQNAMKELQSLHAEHNETKQNLSNHQLEAKSMEIQHGALRDLLGERGIGAQDGRRSRGSPSSNSGFVTPEQTRLRDLEQQLDASVRAHQDTKSSFEQREQEAEQQYRERVEQLEGDYQSAVHYIKGTEKMLKRMKDELARSKSMNVKLQGDLEAAAASGTTRSATDEADWENERVGLKKEIDQLHSHVKTSVSQLEVQLTHVRGELKTVQDERNLYKENSIRSERQITDITHQARAELEQVKSENKLLEQRAQDAEGKVTSYLNQMEVSVDHQRQQSRPIDVNGESGHTRVPSNGTADRDSTSASAMYGPDNRTSLALDNLTSELNALRSHWETNSKNRLSTTFDFEKGLTSPIAPEHSNSLADWRRRLDMEEATAGGRRSGESARNAPGASKTSPNSAP